MIQSTTRNLPLLLRIIHWVLILNFAINIVYGSIQVFYVLAPEGVSGPLWGAARELPHELLVARRLYAIEVWISTVGLALYVGLTEFLPRLLERRA